MYRRLAGYEHAKGAERLSHDPPFRLIGSEKIWNRDAALTSRPQSFEVEYQGFLYQGASWKAARREVTKTKHHVGECFACGGFIVTNLTVPSRAVVAPGWSVGRVITADRRAQAGCAKLPGLFDVARNSDLRSGLALASARRTPSTSKSPV